MKLLLITCVAEYENEVKEILKHSGVQSFSYQPVKGFKNEKDGDLNNWFGITDVPTESIMFTVFIQENCMDEIFEKIARFNCERETLSKIHISCLTIEKFL